MLVLSLVAVTVAAQGLDAAQQAYQAQDYTRALELLQPLAEAGDSEAQIMLGQMYDHGFGVSADPRMAVEWYTRAARQGLPVVQHDLGVRYFKGEGIERDYDQAMRWWQMAANAGLADSQFNLGLMYFRGLGVEPDYARASELFQEAADQGHADAQYSLAVMYSFGQGVEQNYSRALKLFQQAAAQGVAKAQYNLGVFLENGYGVEPDIEQARHWYQKAADQHVAKAIERLAELNGTDPATVTTDRSAATESVITTTTELVGSSAQLRRNDWLRNRAADDYTIQLISLTDEQSIKQYLRDHALSNNGGYIEIIINGVLHYNAIYGQYTDYQSARAAINTLPPAVQSGQPWIRNFGDLQKLLP